MFPFVVSYDAPSNAVNVSAFLDAPTGKHGFVRVADRLVRFGFNYVRLHLFDKLSYGNFMQGGGHTPVALRTDTCLAFDAERVDRFDYFVAELWKRGIYVNLNLHGGRELDARDGFPDKTPWSEKGVDHFVPGLVALQRDYILNFELKRKDLNANALMPKTFRNARQEAACLHVRTDYLL